MSINSEAAAPRLSLLAVFQWLRLCHYLKKFKVTAFKQSLFPSLIFQNINHCVAQEKKLISSSSFSPNDQFDEKGRCSPDQEKSLCFEQITAQPGRWRLNCRTLKDLVFYFSLSVSKTRASTWVPLMEGRRVFMSGKERLHENLGVGSQLPFIL